MTDSLVTLRPNGTGFAGSWTTGAASLHAATSDNSDSTYCTQATAGVPMDLDVGTFAVPALAVVHAVTVRVRAADPSSTGARLVVRQHDPSNGTNAQDGPLTLSASLTTYTGTARTTAPDGGAWTQAKLDALQVEIDETDAVGARVYEVYVDVSYNQAPTVTISVAPTTSTQPSVTLTYSDPEGDALERRRCKVFLGVSAVSNPDSPPVAPVWDSGEVISSALTFQIGVPLANYTEYRVYVKAADAGAGGRYGPWATDTFTAEIDPVGVPVIAVPYPDAGLAAIKNLAVVDRHNLLTRDQSTMEAGVAGWTAETNCSIEWATSGADLRGAHSLHMTPLAAGDIAAATTPTRPAVEPGRLYTALAAARPDSTVRVCELHLRFHDSGGTVITDVKATGAEVAGAWLRLWVSARAPAAATTASIAVKVLAAGGISEIHYIDAAAIVAATANPLENADFDEGALLWTLTQAGTSTAALDATAGAYNAGSVRLAKNDANTPTVATAYRLGCAVGERWVVSMSLRLEATPGVGAEQATIMVVWQDAADTHTYITDLSLGQWARRTVVVDVPSGKTAGQLVVSAGKNGDSASRATILVDGLQIERVPNTALTNGGFESSGSPAVGGRQDHFDGVGWVAETYPTLVSSAVDAFHSGSHSLRLSGSSAADVPASTWIVAAQDVYCAGRTAVSVDYWWRLNNVRQSKARIGFLDGARQLISPRGRLSPLPAGAADADTAATFIYLPAGLDSAGDSGWLHNTFADIPVPAGAVWLVVQLMGGWSYDGINAQQTWFDDVTVTLAGTAASAPFMPGGWTVGGLTGVAVVLERSADGGITWAPVRWPDPTSGRYLVHAGGLPTLGPAWNPATVDYEAERNVDLLYRTYLLADDGASPVSSPPWQSPTETVLAAVGDWLKDPWDPTVSVPVCLEAPQPSTSDERQTVGEPFGSPFYAVQGGGIRGEVVPLAFSFLTDADWQAFETLRGFASTVLVQTTWGDTTGMFEQWYARLGPTRSVTRIGRDGTATQLRQVQIGARQVAPPTT